MNEILQSVLLHVLQRFPQLIPKLICSTRMPLHLLIDLIACSKTSLTRAILSATAEKSAWRSTNSVRLIQAQAKVLPRRIMYTCQWAFFEKEKVQRRFFCFASTKEYFAFFQAWAATQLLRSTSLMECTSGEHPRKWVIDIDAPVASVKKDEMHKQVLQLARDACAKLHTVGFVVERPPDFVILTRHREDKLSWHVVLLVLAPYSQWREIMLAIDPELRATHPKIAPFIDAAVLRNSKGQYMQTLYSCKPQSKQQQGFRFESASMIVEQRLLQELASSMLLPDPFSLLASLKKLKKGKRSILKEAPPLKEASRQVKRICQDIPSLVKEILQDEATTFLHVQNVHRPPLVVQQLLQAGCAEVTWAAQVLHPRVCPRALVQQGIIRKHSSNHALAMAIRQSPDDVIRVFALCHSEKCRAASKNAWVELVASTQSRFLSLLLANN